MNSRELLKRKEIAFTQLNSHRGNNGFRILVGMGTCGIASGAKDVYDAFNNEIYKQAASNVTMTQVGCIGECAFEPMVELIDSNGQSYFYVKLNKEKVKEIVDLHLIQNRPLRKYLLSTHKKGGKQ
jgi:NADP-reducing hydrogenase subunit HndB